MKKPKPIYAWMVFDADNLPYWNTSVISDMHGSYWCFKARRYAKGASQRSDEFVKKVKIEVVG